MTSSGTPNIPSERDVERADQPIDRIAAVREQRKADAIEPGTDQRVDEEAPAVDRQDPADAASRRFEHEEDGQPTPSTTSTASGSAAR